MPGSRGGTMILSLEQEGDEFVGAQRGGTWVTALRPGYFWQLVNSKAVKHASELISFPEKWGLYGKLVFSRQRDTSGRMCEHLCVIFSESKSPGNFSLYTILFQKTRRDPNFIQHLLLTCSLGEGQYCPHVEEGVHLMFGGVRSHAKVTWLVGDKAGFQTSACRTPKPMYFIPHIRSGVGRRGWGPRGGKGRVRATSLGGVCPGFRRGASVLRNEREQVDRTKRERSCKTSR